MMNMGITRVTRMVSLMNEQARAKTGRNTNSRVPRPRTGRSSSMAMRLSRPVRAITRDRASTPKMNTTASLAKDWAMASGRITPPTYITTATSSAVAPMGTAPVAQKTAATAISAIISWVRPATRRARSGWSVAMPGGRKRSR